MSYEDLIQNKIHRVSQSTKFDPSGSPSRFSLDKPDHFHNLFDLANEKQKKKNQQLVAQQQEIIHQANKPKIDPNSQKIFLKKLEKYFNSILDRYLIDDQLSYNRYVLLMKELDVSDPALLDDLWNLLVFNLALDTVSGSIVFNLLMILSEVQLSQTQALKLMTDALTMEMEDLEIPEEAVDFLNLEQLMSSLIQRFKLNPLNHRKLAVRPTSSHKKPSHESPAPRNPSAKKKASEGDVNRFEVLYEHSKTLQQKRRTLQSKIQDDPECSFKPHVNDKFVRRSTNTFDRLYQNAVVQKQNHDLKKANVIKQREEDEMMECTFKPTLTHKTKYKYQPVKGESVVIERLAKARQQKVEKENFYQEQIAVLENKNKLTKQEPFDLSHGNTAQKDKPIILNVDIKLSKSKKAKISIKEGDDIDQVLKGFAKVYQLNQQQVEVIKETLLSHI